MHSLSRIVDEESSMRGNPLDFCTRKLVLSVILCVFSAFCRGQSHPVLCADGSGNFSSKFTNGVTVTVGATKAGSFAQHTCDATIGWNRDVTPVAQKSSQIDIDVMGADLGLNTPVVAFQVKNSALDRLMTYKVYSLEKPPRLLRTITGGDFFSAADTNLGGRNEIWTDDAGAVDGFEGLPLSSFDFAPTVVLRFEKQRLIDVSSEYESHFDDQISRLKSQLDAQRLAEFKQSDGRLQSISPLSMEKHHLLLTTKIKVLEIVWSYLYSGRDQEAWRELGDMWPPADFNRIRGAILDAQAHGIRRQVDGVSTPASRSHGKHHAQIYNMDTESKGIVDMATGQAMASSSEMASPGGGVGEKTSYTVDIKPEPIFLPSLPTQGESQPQITSKIYLSLVIDAAGKVHSAQLANDADKGPIGEMEIRSSAEWRFIPAFKDGRAVACRVRFGVWPYR